MIHIGAVPGRAKGIVKLRMGRSTRCDRSAKHSVSSFSPALGDICVTLPQMLVVESLLHLTI